jgi:PAS domain S-box-containing protein
VSRHSPSPGFEPIVVPDVELLPLIVYVDHLDDESTAVYTSTHAASMLGYDAADWREPSFFWSIVHEGDRARVMELVRRRNRTGEPANAEYRLRAADGRVVWVRDRETILRDAVGRPTLAQGVLVDITDLKRAEEQLERRDAVLEAVARGAALLLATPSWEDVAATLLRGLGEAARASRVYVFERDERDGTAFASMRFEWSAPGIAPQIGNPLLQDLPVAAAGLERWDELLCAGTVVHGPVRGLPQREQAFFADRDVLSLVVAPIRVHGRTWGSIGFDDCVDEREWSAAEIDALSTAATVLGGAIERERSELTVRAAFAASFDAVVITDDERRIVEVNPAACRLYGADREELVGRRVDDLVPPHRLTVLERDWERYVSAETVAEEWELRRPDGTDLVVAASARPNFLPGLHLVFMRDVTGSRQLEQKLAESQRLESIGRLAGGIAHDFNNLLTAIIGYSTLIEQRALAPEAEADLAEIQRAAERGAQLVRQLLAFARRQVLTPEPLDLNAVLDDVGSLLRRVIGEDVRLRMEPARALRTARADRGQLEQVLMNLAVNARQAMPHGGTLTIRTFDLDRPEGETELRHWVALEVSDTGAGMDETTRSRIFEPFFTTRPEGTGLGLATAHGIVSQSGGEIDVSSEPGRGTTFTVLLPAEAAPADPTGSGHGPATVLLVEDEEVVRALARRLLQRRGYTVLDATDGEHALEIAGRHEGPIDLLLTDLVMPGLRGDEVASRVLALRPETRVLYMSGYADDTIDRALVSAPLLEKPFSGDAFARSVREALEQR